MSYLDLLKLASPEAIIAVTALAVLGIGLVSTRASGICSFAATLGLALRGSGLEIFPLREHGERVHAFRIELHLWNVGDDRTRRDRTKVRHATHATATLRRNPHDPRWTRFQSRRRAFPSLGAGRLPGRARCECCFHRVGLESSVVRRAWKNRARRVRSRARQRCMARDDCRLVAGTRRARRFVYPSRQPRRAGANKCSPATRILGCRPRWLHITWTCRGRT